MHQSQNNLLLEVSNLKKYFPITSGFFKKVVGHIRAVDGISFFIRKGETLGLVGESGCGKTTAGRLILNVLPATSGKVIFHQANKPVNVTDLRGEKLRKFRKHMQLVFQDPFSSLNPRMTILNIVGEPLLAHGMRRGKQLEERVKLLMQQVGLNVKYLHRYPHAFSGGQRQRICIARALALNPELVICDEPVSALDVSIQAQIINLLKDLQQQLELTYLFIAHDLSVVENISSRVAVMYVGKIMELAYTEELFRTPLHPYTEALMSAVPKPDPRHKSDRILLQGDVADPSDPPHGCMFHPRCRYAIERCKVDVPELTDTGDRHFVRCHLATELSLKGIGSQA
ncbi:ABC transporter ATP-binding protein [candidate division KSB1 bacterium]|nr:ABC transporter ATP-binding protein [candidate division KSB1 bacterium]